MVSEILAAGAVAVAVLLVEQRLQNLPDASRKSSSQCHCADSQPNFVNRVRRRLIFEPSGALTHLVYSGPLSAFFGRALIVLIIISPFELMVAAIISHRDQELQQAERDLESIKRVREDLDLHHSKMMGQMAVAIDEICRNIDCQSLPAAIQQSVIETRLNERRAESVGRHGSL